MRLRSLLYVPAHVDRFVGKAHERGADAVVLDLEDAVPEGEKDAARDALESAVPAAGRSGAFVFVRVNAGRLQDDVTAAIAAGADGIMVPKVSGPEDLDRLPDGPMAVIAMIETAAALLRAGDIAAHPRVTGLVLGGEDFATDTGARADADVLRLPKLMVHYAAKAHGRLSLGLLRSVAQFDDTQDLARAAAEAVRFGFDGATCIHPKAVPVLNDAFTPTEAEVAHARAILAAAAEAASDGRGALMVEGEFVDAPVVARYRTILSRAGLDPDRV